MNNGSNNNGFSPDLSAILDGEMYDNLSFDEDQDYEALDKDQILAQDKDFSGFMDARQQEAIHYQMEDEDGLPY